MNLLPVPPAHFSIYSFDKTTIMRQPPKHRFIFAMGIALMVLACNNQAEKKDEPAADTAAKASTETAPPAAKEPATDALTVAPGLYKLKSDSLGIQIIEATYKPGDSSVLHTHPADYALYTISGGTTAFYAKDGSRMVNEMKTGSFNIRPADVHSVKNIGKTTVKVLLVEVHRPMGSVTTDASMDATKAAANHYKTKMDSLGLRIVEASYKPGESSAMHSHPDAGVYAISGGTAAFTEKDGTKHTNEMPTGTTMISGAGTHSVKNVGKTTMKVLLVEVNRPRQ